MELSLQLAIAVSLAIDACVVGMAVGCRTPRLTFHPVFRLTFHFGLFQALMPIIGWSAGEIISYYVGSLGHWIAFALLTVVGIRMIYEAFTHSDNVKTADMTRHWSLVVLSIATSVDALAVGISFAFLDVNIWFAALMIGVITSALTFTGMFFGSRLGMKFGNRFGIVGGLVLVAIGLKIVLENGGL